MADKDIKASLVALNQRLGALNKQLLGVTGALGVIGSNLEEINKRERKKESGIIEAKAS